MALVVPTAAISGLSDADRAFAILDEMQMTPEQAKEKQLSGMRHVARVFDRKRTETLNIVHESSICILGTSWDVSGRVGGISHQVSSTMNASCSANSNRMPPRSYGSVRYLVRSTSV